MPPVERPSSSKKLGLSDKQTASRPDRRYTRVESWVEFIETKAVLFRLYRDPLRAGELVSIQRANYARLLDLRHSLSELRLRKQAVKVWLGHP
jgi:hypothetical protein